MASRASITIASGCCCTAGSTGRPDPLSACDRTLAEDGQTSSSPEPGGPKLLLDLRASTPRTPNCTAPSQATPGGTPARLAPAQSEQGVTPTSRTTPGPPLFALNNTPVRTSTQPAMVRSSPHFIA